MSGPVGPYRALAAALAIAVGAAIGAGPGSAEAGTATGTARVIDGMTLAIAGVTYRLFGIDAPDADQVCRRRGQRLPCGDFARTALMDLVAGSVVTCTTVPGGGTDSAGRVAATCAAGGFDIGGNMVHTGWALADSATAPQRYRTIEARARAREVGLWRYSFDRPRAWRARKAGDGTGPDPTVCIRGRITATDAACPVLTGEDGRRVSLAGPERGLRTGQHVCVCGAFVDVSICRHGQALIPGRLDPAEGCP